MIKWLVFFFFFQAEDGIRDFCLSRGLGDVYKRQVEEFDPDPFMEALNKWGLPWIEDHNPVLVD